MKCHKKSDLFPIIIAILTVVTLAMNHTKVNCSKISCSICGKRCLDACGTEAFRPCCLSYNRKRASLGSSSPQFTTDFSGKETAQSTFQSGARQRAIDNFVQQLYASLDGVMNNRILKRTPQPLSYTHKKSILASSGGTKGQLKDEPTNGTPILDSTDSLL